MNWHNDYFKPVKACTMAPKNDFNAMDRHESNCIQGPPHMLVYMYKGSDVYDPLRTLVNAYFMHKGIMVKPL